MSAMLLLTAYSADKSMPSVSPVDFEVTKTRSAAGAMPPAHSRSRSDSVSSFDTKPGSVPLTIVVGRVADRPKAARKLLRSVLTTSLRPSTAIWIPAPVIPAV